MQSRTDKEYLAEILSRPSVQFVTEIETAIPEIKKLLKDQPVFYKDGLEASRAALHALQNTCITVTKQLYATEEKRIPYEMDYDLYINIKEGEDKRDRAHAKLKKLQPDYEKTQTGLRLAMDEIREDIRKLQLDRVGDEGEEIHDENIEFNNLNNRKDALLNEQRRLNKKIQKKCCSCIPSCIENEVEKLAVIDRDLANVNTEMKNLEQKKIENKQENKIKKLENDLFSKQEELKKHINDFPGEKAKVEKQLSHAEKRLAHLNNQQKRKESEYMFCLGRETIFDLVHLYAKFQHLKKAVFDVYSQSQQQQTNFWEDQKKINAKITRLDSLNGYLDELHASLKDKFDHLLYRSGGKLSGLSLYRKFLRLPAAIQEGFISKDFSPNEVMDEIVPKEISIHKHAHGLFKEKSRHKTASPANIEPALSASLSNVIS